MLLLDTKMKYSDAPVQLQRAVPANFVSCRVRIPGARETAPVSTHTGLCPGDALFRLYLS